MATATLTNVLNVVLESQDAQLEQLELIQVDTRALVQGPYNTGMTWLGEAADPHISDEDRSKFIEKAIEKFMDAHGQEHNPFRKAQVEYQLGNCWVLLGNNTRARPWYLRAHKSAVNYLREQEKPAYEAYENYRQSERDVARFESSGENVSCSVGCGFLIIGYLVAVSITGIEIISGREVIAPNSLDPSIEWLLLLVLFAVGIVAISGRAIGRAVGKLRRKQAERAYNQAQKKFKEESPTSVYDFIRALEYLQIEGGDVLDLELSPST